MKLVKRILCLIGVCILITSYAFADHTELKWGMSKNEVYSLMPIFDSICLHEEESNDHLIQKWSVNINNVRNQMFLHYIDNKLFAKTSPFERDEAEARKIYHDLMIALKKKYGKPLDDTSTWNKGKISSYAENITLMESVFSISPIDEFYNMKYYEQTLQTTMNRIKAGQVNMTIWEPDHETYILLVSWDHTDQFTDYWTTLIYISKDYIYKNIDVNGI